MSYPTHLTVYGAPPQRIYPAVLQLLSATADGLMHNLIVLAEHASAGGTLRAYVHRNKPIVQSTTVGLVRAIRAVRAAAASLSIDVDRVLESCAPTHGLQRHTHVHPPPSPPLGRIDMPYVFGMLHTVDKLQAVAKAMQAPESDRLRLADRAYVEAYVLHVVGAANLLCELKGLLEVVGFNVGVDVNSGVRDEFMADHRIGASDPQLAPRRRSARRLAFNA